MSVELSVSWFKFSKDIYIRSKTKGAKNVVQLLQVETGRRIRYVLHVLTSILIAGVSKLFETRELTSSISRRTDSSEECCAFATAGQSALRTFHSRFTTNAFEMLPWMM